MLDFGAVPLVSTPPVAPIAQSPEYPQPRITSLGSGFAPPPGFGFGGGSTNPAFCADEGAGAGAGTGPSGSTVVIVGANRSGISVSKMCDNSEHQQVVQCTSCRNVVTTVTRAFFSFTNF